MIKARALHPGDTVGIVSPSWGGAGVFPHRLELGVRRLEALGFRVRVAPNARNHHGFVSDTPEHRVQDIHELFADPEVRAIIAAIGGDHSCHLLPLLDFELIRKNPKIFMGYSDITVLNVAIWQQTGLVTFNGPTVLTDFAEYPDMLAYTREHFLNTVTVAQAPGEITPAAAWTEEFLDWNQKKDLERPRRCLPSAGWTWLKPGRGEGPLIGGCIESLQHLRGTRYWPNWDGAILFFETSEESPTPERIDGILMDYENMGVLAQLNGLLVGRPMGYSDEQRQELRQRVLERTQAYDFPVLTDMDFGHTAPQMTLPLGCRARLDGDAQHFVMLEAAVS